jgi:hypothetical protein
MEKKLARLQVVDQLIGLALVVFVASVAVVGCGHKEENAASEAGLVQLGSLESRPKSLPVRRSPSLPFQR